MPHPKQLHDVVREILGREKADELLRSVLDDVRKTKALEKLLESRRRDALRECTETAERHGGVHPELLEALGPKGLWLVARVASDSSSKRSFGDGLDLAKQAIEEGILIGMRRFVRKLVEKRLGPLEPPWSLALEAADSDDLNACYQRLAEADTVREVFDPLVSSMVDQSSGYP